MPEAAHPPREELGAFLRAELAPADTRRVVRHLLSGCPECSRVTARLWPAAVGLDRPGAGRDGAAADREVDFDRALGRFRARAARVAAERAELAELERELDRHPPARRLVLAMNSRRYHSWSLCRRLGERAFAEGFREPRAALGTAELGVAISEELDRGRYGPALVNDARGRAWAVLGNARRINSDLAGAEEAMIQASRLLEEGTGDPLEQARLSSLLGYLRHDQRALAEAVRLFEKAAAIHRKLGDDHGVGEALADKGTSLGRAGELDRAIRCLEEALGLLDPERNPRRVLAAKHNLSLFLHDNGDVGQALALLKQILPLYASQGDRMNLLRLRWLEGKLAQAQRQFERAEQAFQEVQAAFVERSIPYDAALVSLDLATVYLEGGRYPEIRRLAGQMLEIFHALGVHPEALAALALFARAAEMESLTLRFIAELAAHFEQAENNPGLRFEPSPDAG